MDEGSKFWSFEVPSYKQDKQSEDETVDEINVHAEPWLQAYLVVTTIVCVIGFPSNCVIIYLIAKRKLYRDFVWFLHAAFYVTLILRIIMVPIEYHASRHPSGFAYETTGSCKAFHFFYEFTDASSNLMLLAVVFMRLLTFTPLRQNILKNSTISGTLVCIAVFLVAFLSIVPVVSYLNLYVFDTNEKEVRFCHPDYDKYDAYIRWNKFKVGCTTFLPFILGLICTIIMVACQSNFYRRYCGSTDSYLRQVDGANGQNNQNEIGSINKSDVFMEDRLMVDGILYKRSEQEERRITILHVTFMVIYMVILLPSAIVVTMAVHHISAYTSDLHTAIRSTHVVSITVGMIYSLASFIIIPIQVQIQISSSHT
ncbi:uncharacterized protein LOC117105819 [Anneissia japonica]|uniref:uncharacterized protein LOC117105819 n=1 Tax=Anneissia japonica TaxID=1529436 RepID=UPI0014255E1C|nr:uncharacterized protein LOC117105819 [Anneissia japonica]